jgi:hypothetical protein
LGSRDEKYLPKSRRFGPLTSRPVLLWLVLNVAFAAIWYFLNSGGTGEAPRHAARDTSSGDAGRLPLILTLAVFGLFFGFFRWMVWRVRRFNDEAAAALKLFAAADYAGAAARFADLLRRYRRPASVRTTATFNLAMAQMRTGDLEGALAALSALDPGLPHVNPALRPTVAGQIACLYAFRGDPAAADRWIDEALARAKKSASPRLIDGTITLARAVNAIRRDEREAASRDLAAAWEALEGTLVASELRPFRVLRAFATARGDAAALCAAARAALTESRPGELDWMGKEWPELRAFLEAAR